MKQEDFERMKDVCEKEGFVLSTGGVIPGSSILVEVYKKDPWDWVEFAEAKDTGKLITSGKVYKVLRNGSHGIDVFAETGKNEVNISKIHFKPSTESAYIDQLKKEAFEKHNGRLESSKIDHSNMDGGEIHFSWETGKDPFLYRKDTDTLYWCGIPIYQSGKWATRVKERVEVEPVGLSQERCGRTVLINLTFEVNSLDFTLNGAHTYLASQLEAYLNR